MTGRLRRAVLLLPIAALVGTTTLVVAPATAAPPGAVDLEVYEGTVDAAGVETMRELGLDAEEFVVEQAPDGGAEVEAVLSPGQAAKLESEGIDLEVKTVDGLAASEALQAQSAGGYEAFRPYGTPGGIKDEFEAAAADHPDITKLVTIGQSVQGQDIIAMKVTKNAQRNRDGQRPAVIYMSTQHAREWITTEMTRRLMHYVTDGYGTDPQITELVNTRELWFVPVANPDGYDFTHTEGNRLWRKNLRDNNGDGQITVGDGVDLNRNFGTKWGYDNEGSSPDPASDTYRGPAPNSEPETQALNGLFERLSAEFLINYHSAAELLLYGIGWQVSTPSPDDVIYEAMVGTDANPAVPGYDPDISAELYTTNGDTDTHATVAYGTLGFTPEMTTCTVASDSVPDDEWFAEDCVSGFIFPDDEELIQAEFEKNIPFALSVATSAGDPDDPVSALGLDAPDLVADPFTVSYGTEQEVAVWAKRSLRNVRANWTVNGGEQQTAKVVEWQGGERYGDTHDDYYAEWRATITAAPGDEVSVWFTGRDTPGGAARSTEPFTYTVAEDIGGQVLVLAVEDVTGISPAQGVTTAKYAAAHAASIEAAGYTADIYDFDANGRQVPHHLGVLSHYDAVFWETGDDVILRAPGQVPGTAAEAALDIELSVRDYLNEGGKLIAAGKYNQFAQSGAGGTYYYNPFQPPECTTPSTYPCLPLLNDFQQYWLGAYVYVSDGGTGDDGEPYGLVGTEGEFTGFTGDLNAPGSAENQDHTALLLSTSSFLPPDQFPQFASAAPLDWDIPGGPFDPYDGGWYLYSQQPDAAYERLTRTVDLTGATSGELRFWTSYDTELDFDYLFVEAHTVGQDDWTTLPDVNGKTTTEPGESCLIDWNTLHPWLDRYQTKVDDETCLPTGTTGEWNAATGNSGGWQEFVADLSAYAGSQVEVSITFATDFAFQGTGVFLDLASVVVDGATVSETSFEEDLGGWTVAGAPEGSPGNSSDWIRTQLGFEEGAATTTEDTVFAGFGFEGLAPAERDDLMARSLAHVFGGATP